MAISAADGVCDECGFDYDRVADDEVGPALRDFGRRYRMPLTRGLKDESLDDIVRAHPTPGVWSALEYACHVRDVFLVQRDRLYTTLVEDKPVVAPMYREQRVTLARYNAQDPTEVATQLTTAARLIAQAFDALDSVQFQRLCIYNFPAPAERPLLWVGQHAVHEGETPPPRRRGGDRPRPCHCRINVDAKRAAQMDTRHNRSGWRSELWKA